MAWSLVESELIEAITPGEDPREEKKNIAIVGAGFAGLTLAAALLKKKVNAHITLFEQRDTLLSLQQGSDSRWLHPRIYDWPRTGSQSSVAMLPVLNWTASRASDVVVQVLSQWRNANIGLSDDDITLYCNARHLQIHESATVDNCLTIEWVGEKRCSSDGTTLGGLESSSIGKSKNFHNVILAVGFGLEKDGVLSYWRNETHGQPSLDEPRRTYLVSGQGDGAMIDLLRARISQYRQDRILDEVFVGNGALLDCVQRLHKVYTDNPQKAGLFADFELMENEPATRDQFDMALDKLRRRLRRDTDVILRLEVRKLSQLFDPSTSRISFQNKLLVFLLYKCGGFVPSNQAEEALVAQHHISENRIIRRHGTLRDSLLRELLSEKLYKAIETRRGGARPDPFSQTDEARWPGGYFDYPGPTKNTDRIGDNLRAHWRREYLPGPTELLATAFCAAVAGALLINHAPEKRLRVTLHRAMVFNGEELLQQACDYEGTANARGTVSAAGRTFPAINGTIGQAYACRRIVRSVAGVSAENLNRAMGSVRLKEASREMSKEVSFVLAIPLLEPEKALIHTLPSPVLGVLYIDSTDRDYFVDDQTLRHIVSMASVFIQTLDRLANSPVDRVKNVPLAELADTIDPPKDLPASVKGIISLVDELDSPRLQNPLQLNFDYSDFSPIQASPAS
ncbi:MAG: NAD(P)-binding protein [Acidovorax sp.]|uniref:NAD(P)-binding protein n=1 Tax=Acidovorax sp. TaxID=1872122 RepID=UPI00391C9613